MNVIRSVNYVADSIADKWSIDNITEWTSDEEIITGKHIASVSYFSYCMGFCRDSSQFSLLVSHSTV